MQAQYEARNYVAPDAMSAAASYIEREYGYGYRIGVAMGGSIAVFEVRHFDGSAFNLIADRWGNVRVIPEGASREATRQMVHAMYGKATKP